MNASVGHNDSERYLSELCNRTFLSLWSYPNVYRDQSIGGANPEGKEICDLLVVFGNRVIIFSDKYCEFPDTGQLDLDWKRWYRRAILDSYKQIQGAARWIRKYPNRIFVDRACITPLPLSIPTGDDVQFHYVVVAHGASRRCKRELGGSGSLMLHYEDQGQQYPDVFISSQIGDRGEIVHVLDDFTVDVLVRNLDTISDFVNYLDWKEALLSSGVMVFAAGEEELLAHYLSSLDQDGKHGFISGREFDGFMAEEGLWDDFVQSALYKNWKEANRSSYLWDKIVEELIRSGGQGQGRLPVADLEQILRGMAAEPRFHRRSLANLFSNLATRDHGKVDIFARTVSPFGIGPYYLMMALRQPEGLERSVYASARSNLLAELSHAVRARYPEAREVIGLATDLGPKDVFSIDAFWADLSILSPEEVGSAVEIAKQVGLHRTFSERHLTTYEFPGSLVPGRVAKGRYRNVPCHCGSGLKFKHCCGHPAA